MNGRRPPRRPRWPKASDNMAIALRLAAKPAAADINEIMATVTPAAEALRVGVATEMQWCIVAGAVDLSKSIERQGVVRGLVEHLNTMQATMQAIYDRAHTIATWHPPLVWCEGPWQPPALWFHERDTIATFLELHAFQIDKLGRAEFLKALDAATADIKRNGDRVTVARDLAGMAAC